MRQFLLRSSLLIVAAASAASANAQFESAKQVYEAPQMEEKVAQHKTVAILPFKATIGFKRLPKNYDATANAQEEKNLATQMQEGMYTFLLRKADKYTCTFQDINRTNQLLKKNGLMDRLDEVPYDSVCQLLGVDAVIRSRYAYQRTSSEGGAIVKTVLFGSIAGGVANGTLTMQVYDGKDGALLWRFNKEMGENVMSNSEVMAERMMRKVSRNFPYEK